MDSNDEVFENFTKLTESNENFLSMEIEEYTVVDKILSGIAWGLFNVPCNAMMFGLVQFDRLGGDPLKRRVTDQVSKFFLGPQNDSLKSFIFLFCSSSQTCSLISFSITY